MKTQLLIILFFQTLVLCAQSLKVPIDAYSFLEKRDSFLAQIDLEKLDSEYLDGLLSNNSENINTVIDILYKTRHDSLYHVDLYTLVNSIDDETEISKLIEITNKIVAYGNDALIAVANKPSSSSNKTTYWRELIKLLIVGYDLDIPINHFENFDPRKNKRIDLHIENRKKIRKIESLIYNWVRKQSIDLIEKSLHKNVVANLKRGTINSKYKNLVRHVIQKEVEFKREDLLEDYFQLLENIEEKQALWLIYLIGSSSGTRYYPNFLFKSLNHHNEKFVLEAMSWNSGCSNKKMMSNVKNKIHELFYSNNGKMKYHCSFHLMHDYENPDGLKYLLEEVQLNALGNRGRTLAWIGDACNAGNIMTDDMHNILKEFLYDEDKQIKRAAIECYLTYSGENMLNSIIEFIDYELDFIAKQIEEEIIDYPDKKIAKNLLKNKIQLEQNEKRKEKLEKLLEQLK